jgi:hypothetical protein
MAESTNRSNRDKKMAAYMKQMGIERTHGRCAICYRIITIDSIKSRYRHICHG